MLASSSHMEGAGELGCDFQDLRQSLRRKGTIEGVIDLFERHAAREAFEDQRHRQPRPANGQFPAQEFWIGDDPPIILVGRWLPVWHLVHISILDAPEYASPGSLRGLRGAGKPLRARERSVCPSLAVTRSQTIQLLDTGFEGELSKQLASGK